MLKLNGYGGPQAKVNGKSQRFKGVGNFSVSHSYLYHNDEISADMVSVIGKPISQSRLGRHFTLSNESML